MTFELQKSIEILEKTPDVLSALLNGLSDEWLHGNEGADTWSPYDVVGHLIHGEKTDWVPRMNIILSERGDKEFKPFDRFAQFEESKGKSIIQLLEEFRSLRNQNVNLLKAKKLNESDMDRIGVHPAFGPVTLRQLLSTWVVHDLTHIVQISRVMATQYRENVGPWVEYLGVLKPR